MPVATHLAEGALPNWALQLQLVKLHQRQPCTRLLLPIHLQLLLRWRNWLLLLLLLLLGRPRGRQEGRVPAALLLPGLLPADNGKERVVVLPVTDVSGHAAPSANAAGGRARRLLAAGSSSTSGNGQGLGRGWRGALCSRSCEAARGGCGILWGGEGPGVSQLPLLQHATLGALAGNACRAGHAAAVGRL